MGSLALSTHPITMLVILLCLAAAALSTSTSSVSVQYSLQAQLPLIARVNESYSWSFSPDTFASASNASLIYTTSALPAWLSFNNSTLTFYGTPSPTDEGTPGVSVTATDPDTSDSASSDMTICVTPYSAPQLHIPISEQFYATNPSLSSVFLVSKESALASRRPSLWIPPRWSFSIGFLSDTFTAGDSGNLYYDALRADGAPLPEWMAFNANELTLNGVTPSQPNPSGPLSVPLALYVSDQQDYSAASAAFDIIISEHDLSLSMATLPTINITASAPFNFTLTSPDDFFGILLDGQPIQPSEITNLDIDTSQYKSWLKYDPTSQTLSGTAPDDSDGDADSPVLPVTLTASNQTINTNVSIAIVPSYFSTATFQPMLVLPGESMDFHLVQYFANVTGLGTQRDDVNITAVYDPASAGQYMKFDPSTAQLTGTIPGNGSSSYSHITVTFTAYSRITHSTSHASLPISLSTSDYAHQQTGGLSAAARAKLLLGLKIGFGIVSGIAGLAFILAFIRRWARVADTAVDGEHGTRAWTKEEMKWYGIGIEVDGKATEGPPHSSQDGNEGDSHSEKSGHSISSPRALGATLQRVLTRTVSNTHSMTGHRSALSPQTPQSPGFMRKGEFMGKIRTTARIVSDKYRRSLNRRKMPVISKPTLIMTSDHRVSAMTGVPIEGLPFSAGPNIPLPGPSHPAPIPFEDMNLSQYAPSGLSSIANSPSSSTDARSIPRRRADFAPPKAKKGPKAPVQAHLTNKDVRRRSDDSAASGASSMTSNSSSRTHEAEAVVQRAARATSMRTLSTQAEGVKDEHGRPRLVPFTSATRVPVPKLPSALLVNDPDKPVNGAVQTAHGGAKTKRVASQVAKIFRNGAGAERRPVEDVEKGVDDLNTSAQYVRTLGEDAQSARSLVRTPSGSFSVESSHNGHDAFGSSGKIPIVPRMLARTGEQFKFRVPVSYSAGSPLTSDGSTPRKQKSLEARLMSGKPLPGFVKSDLNAVTSASGARVEKRVVEFWGVPTVKDTGELNIGIYERDGDKCVGRVIIQIVGRS